MGALLYQNPQITNEERIDVMHKFFLKGVDLLLTSTIPHRKFYENGYDTHGYQITTQEPEKLNQLNKDFLHHEAPERGQRRI